MAYEVVNRLRSTSVIRVDGVSTTTLALSDLSTGANETVNSASIKRVNWSTSGSITIARGGTNILTLTNSGEMQLDDYGFSIANNSTGNIVITVTTGGSAIIEMSKSATYTTALTGM